MRIIITSIVLGYLLTLVAVGMAELGAIPREVAYLAIAGCFTSFAGAAMFIANATSGGRS